MELKLIGSALGVVYRDMTSVCLIYYGADFVYSRYDGLAERSGTCHSPVGILHCLCDRIAYVENYLLAAEIDRVNSGRACRLCRAAVHYTLDINAAFRRCTYVAVITVVGDLCRLLARIEYHTVCVYLEVSLSERIIQRPCKVVHRIGHGSSALKVDILGLAVHGDFKGIIFIIGHRIEVQRTGRAVYVCILVRIPGRVIDIMELSVLSNLRSLLEGFLELCVDIIDSLRVCIASDELYRSRLAARRYIHGILVSGGDGIKLDRSGLIRHSAACALHTVEGNRQRRLVIYTSVCLVGGHSYTDIEVGNTAVREAGRIVRGIYRNSVVCKVLTVLGPFDLERGSLIIQTAEDLSVGNIYVERLHHFLGVVVYRHREDLHIVRVSCTVRAFYELLIRRLKYSGKRHKGSLGIGVYGICGFQIVLIGLDLRHGFSHAQSSCRIYRVLACAVELPTGVYLLFRIVLVTIVRLVSAEIITAYRISGYSHSGSLLNYRPTLPVLFIRRSSASSRAVMSLELALYQF